MQSNLPSPEFLRKILRYDPCTGDLFWNDRTPDMFQEKKRTPESACLLWNARYGKKNAFTAISGGYYLGSVNDKMYKAHRVAWAIHYGEWPCSHIDHIDGDRSNNAIGNLRDVSPAENSKNLGIRSTNTSGISGVVWLKRRGKWMARGNIDGKAKYLGEFLDKDDAKNAVDVFRKCNGFHGNHGARMARIAREALK